MNRTDILRTAQQYITQDRASTHGEAENNFNVIAELWSCYLNVPITEDDFSAMMILMKLGRIKGNPTHADNWIDICGYSAIGGELSVK